MAETYRTRHKISGVIDENTPEHLVNHVELGKYFEIVGPDAKPFLPEMHRTSLPLDATKDDLEVARVAGFTNPGAFQDAVADFEAAKAEADAKAAEAKTTKDEK